MQAVLTFQAVISEDFLGGFPRLATGSGMIATEKACDLPTGTNMGVEYERPIGNLFLFPLSEA